MPRTIGDCIRQARASLNDTNVSMGYRYSDTDLYGYFSDAMTEVRRLRPDLLVSIGVRASLPIYTPADSATLFPIDAMYFAAFSYYVTGRAEFRDNEAGEDSRAAQFVAAFITTLKGAA